MSPPHHNETNASPALLAPYRVLDLTDERGLIAGHLLAQMGADVVQVELPEGSPARRMGPFAPHPDGPDQSMFWGAYSAGKRSIALAIDDPAAAADRETLLRLVARADVLIESASPGRMAELGLDYATLREVNPRLVYVSITAFGSSGPKAGYADSDLIVWASAGPLELKRAPSGLPLRISFPQAYHQAATDAVCGALMALLARGDDGTGQHVEVSAQASSTLCTLFGHLAAAVNHHGYAMHHAGLSKQQQQLDLSGSGSRTMKTRWPVKDGVIEMHVGIGTAAGRFSNALFAWLKSIDACPEAFADFNWIQVPEYIQAGKVTLDEIDDVRDYVGTVLARHTMQELVVIAQQWGMMLAPILTAADIMDSPQLVARDFFAPVGDGAYSLPSPFNHAGAPPTRLRSAPAIGENGAEVLRDWLGLDGAAAGAALSRETA